VVKATKEVIVSAGAYESPHLLLKSGIGPAAELKQAGVTPQVDLPGVGKVSGSSPLACPSLPPAPWSLSLCADPPSPSAQHLQDHPIIGLKYRLGPPERGWAIPTSASKLWLALPSVPWAWLRRGQGVLSSSGCDLGYFGASSEIHEGRPDLQMHGMITAGDEDFYTKVLKDPCL